MGARLRPLVGHAVTRSRALANSKTAELAVCRLAGAERSGPTGRIGPDCTPAAPWAIQVKRYARPQLPAKWLEQARRDALLPGYEGRPWLLVQVVPRPGLPSLLLATLEAAHLWHEYRYTLGQVAEYARRYTSPQLRAADVRKALAGPTPWVITTRCPGEATLATLDYRTLCQWARARGYITGPHEEAT